MKAVYATVEVLVAFEEGEDWRAKLPAGSRLQSATVEYDVDPEQCLFDLDCEYRAWSNGYCGPHQPDPRSYH